MLFFSSSSSLFSLDHCYVRTVYFFFFTGASQTLLFDCSILYYSFVHSLIHLSVSFFFLFFRTHRYIKKKITSSDIQVQIPGLKRQSNQQILAYLSHALKGADNAGKLVAEAKRCLSLDRVCLKFTRLLEEESNSTKKKQ